MADLFRVVVVMRRQLNRRGGRLQPALRDPLLRASHGHREGARPVREVLNQDKLVVLMRPLKGNAVAVGLFNRNDQASEMSVKWPSPSRQT